MSIFTGTRPMRLRTEAAAVLHHALIANHAEVTLTERTAAAVAAVLALVDAAGTGHIATVREHADAAAERMRALSAALATADRNGVQLDGAAMQARLLERLTTAIHCHNLGGAR
jgi:Zn-dependent oligopeptidase